MLRIGFKFSCNGLNQVCKIKRPHSRFHSGESKYWYIDGRYCRNLKYVSRNSVKNYSTTGGSEKSGGSGIKLLLFGTVTVGGTGAILTYAKSYPEFRATLEQWIPGTDRTIKIIFQEEGTYFDYISNLLGSTKRTILDLIASEPEDKKGLCPIDSYKPPKPAFQPLVEKPKPVSNDPFNEVRVSKDKGKKIEVVVEKPKPVIEPISSELLPDSLVELEKFCGEAAAKAIDAYKQAKCALEDYNDDVVRVVETVNTSIDGSIWERLKQALEKKQKALETAEENANKALRSLKRMYSLVDDSSLKSPPELKVDARRNIRKIIDDVDQAKKKFDDEVNSMKIADRFWNTVKSAREHFNDELKILFPNIDIEDKKFKVNEDAFDLFVLHMYHKVIYYQKELARLQTINELRLRNAIKSLDVGSDQERLSAMISAEMDREKRIIMEDFNMKLLKERKNFNEEMKKQLKLQAQVHADHLREALEAKEMEVKRTVKRSLSEQAEAEMNKYKQQLAALSGRLHGLDAVFKARLAEDKGACEAQMLWAACQALARAVKVAPLGVTADKAVRPLDPEIQAIRKAASMEDSLVRATIDNIPPEATKRGVFPEDALRSRFLKVEDMARRLALVPEEGAALPVYLLSYIQSLLLSKSVSSIPKSELQDEPIDVDKLNTYDILYRARYWLDRGDFKMTLRYMNLLKGAPRSVARDWMNETRILLETQQAVDTLIAYAGATGLVFLGGGDSKEGDM